MSELRERFPPQGIIGGTGLSAVWFPFTDPDANLGRNPGYEMVDGENITVRQVIYLPFTPSAVYVVVIPAGTGDLYAQIDTDFSAQGEAYNINVDTIAAAAYAVTANERERIAIIAAFTGALDEDYVGVDFNRQGDDPLDTVGASVYYHGLLVVP